MNINQVNPHNFYELIVSIDTFVLKWIKNFAGQNSEIESVKGFEVKFSYQTVGHRTTLWFQEGKEISFNKLPMNGICSQEEVMLYALKASNRF